uniref:ABC transporter permease n=1 Tax=Mesorhizobium sp. WSM4875 TaxID=3038539 RepID=UPI0024176876|nr:ABC transporter permease [Mesorhizobium sp. WSM4875]WIE94645.1 ABC transporter permease [Mesorhizobium sp. WSM4875]
MINYELLSTYGPRMLWGLVVTLQLVVTSAFAGFLLGLPLALARNSNTRWLSWPARFYISFFRGTPLLAQLFLVYYGVSQIRLGLQDIGLWWFFKDPYLCAVFAFTINTAAYQGEILRGALSSLPKGQIEAAKALGLGRWVSLAKVQMPQAMVLALRPLGNELVLSFKASAIASIVTVPELMQATKLAFSRSFDFEVYLWAAVLYLMLVETIRRIWGVFERHLTRHTRAAVALVPATAH